MSDVLILLRDDNDLDAGESFFVDLTLIQIGMDPVTVCDTATVVIMDNEPTEPPTTMPRTLTLNTNSKLSLLLS